MKKLIFSLMLALMSVLSVNAQTAIQEQKMFDNTYAGVVVSASTPLDFNSVFPLNTTFGVKLGKDFSPVLCLEAEYTVSVGENHFTDVPTFVKGHYLGLNGTVNVINLFAGYKGQPRFVEPKLNLGIGWTRKYGSEDLHKNGMAAKTGVDVYFNFRQYGAIVLTPAVYWNLYDGVGTIQFNKHNAQLALQLGYIYRFKTSNGTHNFRSYNIGELNDKINLLRERNERLKHELALSRSANKRTASQLARMQKQATDTVTVYKQSEVVVMFAQNSAELTDEAKTKLDNVNGEVDIVATASPEGTDAYNKTLSEKRAAAVAEYLTSRGQKVNTVTGAGVQTQASNRVAVITIK